MSRQQMIDAVLRQLKGEAAVEGVFLSGSLVNEYKDRFADIDLGVVSGNSAHAYETVWALRHTILAAIAPPLHYIERGWDHCQLVAALYGKSLYPPIGLEVDLVFSQLQHANEQMPYAPYQILFDRSGGLAVELGRLGLTQPKEQTRDEIAQQLRGFPFCIHDALKAIERGDDFHAQSLLETMRSAVFVAAAIRAGSLGYGSKRAYRYLSADERAIIEDSYSEPGRQTVAKLAALFIQCLNALLPDYPLQPEIEHLERIRRELL